MIDTPASHSHTSYSILIKLFAHIRVSFSPFEQWKIDIFTYGQLERDDKVDFLGKNRSKKPNKKRPFHPGALLHALPVSVLKLFYAWEFYGDL